MVEKSGAVVHLKQVIAALAHVCWFWACPNSWAGAQICPCPLGAPRPQNVPLATRHACPGSHLPERSLAPHSRSQEWTQLLPIAPGIRELFFLRGKIIFLLLKVVPILSSSFSHSMPRASTQLTSRTEWRSWTKWQITRRRPSKGSGKSSRYRMLLALSRLCLWVKNTTFAWERHGFPALRTFSQHCFSFPCILCSAELLRGPFIHCFFSSSRPFLLPHPRNACLLFPARICAFSPH